MRAPGPTEAADTALEAIATGERDHGAHLVDLLRRVPADDLVRRAAAAAEAAFAGGVWMEVDRRRAPITVALRPRTLDLATRGYVHHVTWQVRMGLRRLASLRERHPMIAAALPLADEEAAWIARYQRADGHGPGERVFCRLDALARFDGPGWRSTLHFIEPNVVGIGGMSYAPVAERALLDHIVPALQELDPDLTLEPNHDPRDLLLDELLDHARLLGVDHPPTLAFVDDKDLYTLGGEFGRLVAHFRAHGVDALYVDPRELELAGDGTILAEGRPVDVIFRFLEIRELIAMEAAGHDLRALHAAFQAGRVVPSVAGDIEHKSTFEVLSDPDLNHVFTDEQRAVFREHVLWTRLFDHRWATAADGTTVDLVDHARRGRERLVLKPNRTFGGKGVVVGPAVDPPTWEAALDAALAEPRSHVLQALAPLRAEPTPRLDPTTGALDFRPCFSAVGFYPGRRGLGVFGRFASDEVVNIFAGGGVTPFLVNVA